MTLANPVRLYRRHTSKSESKFQGICRPALCCAAAKASKGVRRMPRLRKAKKDVASCEKLGGAASAHRSQDIRMGQPGGSDPATGARRRGERGELKHLSTRRRREQNVYSPSSGERTGRSPNRRRPGVAGVVGPRYGKKDREWKPLESGATAGESPLHEAI